MLGRVKQWWLNLLYVMGSRWHDAPNPLVVYLIGSLRNPQVPRIAAKLRRAGFEVFDEWHSVGSRADDHFRDYERARGHKMAEALQSWEAKHIFEFDRTHLMRADVVVLVLPCGKSGHLELGWALGRGKRGYVLQQVEPARFDIMYQFADGVFRTVPQLVEALRLPAGRVDGPPLAHLPQPVSGRDGELD